MAVYSENKDWTRLVEVLVRMAGVVDDDKLKGKYLSTAAAILHSEVSAFDQAAEHYERALGFDPTLDNAFRGLCDCLQRTAAWEHLARATRQHIERTKERSTEEQLAALWDNLAEVFHYRLNRMDDAVEAYEQAHSLDRENRTRVERLVEIYGKHANRYADRAIASHAELLEHNPYRVESYKALRKLYTQLSRPDEAWTVCQALRSLSMAEPDEEAFFKRHRVQAPATARECITEELWHEYLLHEDQDPLLTSIFATLQPAAVSALAQPPSGFGITRDGQMNCEVDSSLMAQMLFYASGVSLVALPPVFRRPNDAGGRAGARLRGRPSAQLLQARSLHASARAHRQRSAQLAAVCDSPVELALPGAGEHARGGHAQRGGPVEPPHRAAKDGPVEPRRAADARATRARHEALGAGGRSQRRPGGLRARQQPRCLGGRDPRER
jgi:hypothetical protein